MLSRRKKRVYLDVAASAPVSQKSLAVYMRHLSLVGNPSSLHQEGARAKEVLEDARVRIAHLAQVRAHNVVFTSGATEANTLAIVGYIRKQIQDGVRPEQMHVLFHTGAHSSVVESVAEVQRLGVQTEPLALLAGLPDTVALKKQIRPETVLVILESVSGETGSIFSTRDVRRALDSAVLAHKTRVRLHVDASQAPRVQSIVLSQLGADSLALDAQKVGGVRGIGALLFSREPHVTPLMFGGPQERDLRPGTENPALASAFASALEECQDTRELFLKRAREIRGGFLRELTTIKDMDVHESSDQAPHIISLSFLNRDTDYLLFLLDAKGYAVSTKSACESGKEGSRMVALMSGSDSKARSTLRVSFGPDTTETDLVSCAKEIVRSIRFLDENALY